MANSSAARMSVFRENAKNGSITMKNFIKNLGKTWIFDDFSSIYYSLF